MASEDTTLQASQGSSQTQLSDLTAAMDQTWAASFTVEGMKCSACSTSITEAVLKMDGVQDVRIDLLANSLLVVYKGSSRFADRIKKEIDDLEYPATLVTLTEQLAQEDSQTEDSQTAAMRTVQIKIEGLSNDYAIERVVNILDQQFGDELEVMEQPTLRHPVLTARYLPFLPNRSIRSIVSTIKGASDSFTPSIYHPPTIEERSKEVERLEKNRILIRLLVALVAAVPSLVIGVVFMMILPEEHPMRQLFTNPLWPGNVSWGAWIMFGLATIVFFFAADLFHRRALKDIFVLWRPGTRVPLLRRFIRFGSMDLLVSAGTTVAYVSSVAEFILQATTEPADPAKNASDNNSGMAMSNTDTYFDSVVFLTFFLLLGRLLDAITKSKTSEAVTELGKLRPETAKLVLAEENSGEQTNNFKQPSKAEMISIDLLEIGDHVIVAQGSSPPLDGTIIRGDGKFDESSLTGESKPVLKVVGETVYAGTINVGNPITMQVIKIGGSSMLDQIVQVVREGLSKPAPVERLADLLTGYFVPVITLLAILTFVIWVTLGYSGVLPGDVVKDQPGGWVVYSLGFAISVFVAACPCGIGLAAPTALYVGISLAAKHGILVRGGGAAFQDAPRVDAVVFDKTGTLTEGGDLTVTHHKFIDDEDPQLTASIASQMEENSNHPIARAIVSFLSDKPKACVETRDIEEEAGCGMHGTFVHDGTTYSAVIGSAAFINRVSPGLVPDYPSALDELSAWQTQALSVAIVAARPSTTTTTDDDETSWRLLALFGISDPLRPSAFRTIQELTYQGIPIYMLSGDTPTTAQAVAARLGIPATHVYAGVLPTEKADRIHILRHELTQERRGGRQRRRRRRRRDMFTSFGSTLLHRAAAAADDDDVSAAAGQRGATETPSSSPSDADDAAARIAFVGDGINDAPALLAADVGIALGSGAPVAMTAAAFILLTPTLDRVPLLFRLARRVMRRVAWNYGWAGVYNACLVPLAAGALWWVREGGFRLDPQWAALAMACSSLSVLLSSLALKWEGPGWRGHAEEEEETAEAETAEAEAED